MAADNRMVLLTSVTAGNNQDELNTAGLLVGELAINTNDGILFAGADPSGTGDGSTPKAAGQPVHDAADVLGIKLSTASTAQAVGTGNSPAFAGATINDGNLTINNGTTSSATEGGKLILAADDGQVMADNHRLGVLEFKGAEDTSATLTTGARIQAICDATWSSSENGASLEFYTTDGNASESVALTLDSNNLATFSGAVTANGGTVTIGTADINGGNIDGATIATSDVTVGSGKTLNVSGGTLTTSAAQKKAIVEGVGADTDIGAYELRAQTFESDVATGTAPFTIASTTMVDNLNADLLDGVEASAFALLAGATFSGDIAMGANSITGVADPSNAQDAATKAYVDATAQGLYIHEPVVVATTAELNATYNNGTAGVGATLTNAGTQAAIAIDGITLTANERVLVKDQSTGSTQFENGIYQASTLGNGSTNWVLTRVTDFDAAADVKSGAFVFVQEGSVNADSGFVQTDDTASRTMGSTAIAFSQFSGAGQITAGTNLSKSGNTLNVDDAFLKNDASDSTSGTITAAGFTTTGTWTFDTTGGSTQGITEVTKSGDTFSDSDAALMTAAAIDDRFATSAGIASVVADTTPQLGGQLDVNGQAIGDGTRELLTFTEDGSAVNHINIENQATGSGPIISAAGDDANVELVVAAKGTGGVKLTTNSTRHVLFDFDGATANKTHTIVSSHTDNRTLTLADGNTTLVAGTMITTSSNVGDLADSTSAAIGIGTIELGAASDTTLSRSAAGKLAVEGVDVCLLSGAQTLAAKTISGGTF